MKLKYLFIMMAMCFMANAQQMSIQELYFKCRDPAVLEKTREILCKKVDLTKETFESLCKWRIDMLQATAESLMWAMINGQIGHIDVHLGLSAVDFITADFICHYKKPSLINASILQPCEWIRDKSTSRRTNFLIHVAGIICILLGRWGVLPCGDFIGALLMAGQACAEDEDNEELQAVH